MMKLSKMKLSKNDMMLGAISMVLVSISAMTSTSALAETTGYNQISFSTEAKAEVANDEVQAIMYKKVQAKDAKSLAKQLNTATNQAMMLAKRYPNVQVTSGQQNSYPRYDKRSKIVGWTGQANINIKSTDIESASKLIADLQDSLVLDNLNFGISEKRQDQLKKELMIKVSKNFQQQADTLTQAWGSTGYRVIKVNLNTGGNYHHRPMMDRVFATKASADSSVPAPEFAAGNSTITVTADGTIELTK